MSQFFGVPNLHIEAKSHSPNLLIHGSQEPRPALALTSFQELAALEPWALCYPQE